MSTLFVWRERLQEIYAKYSAYILKALQLILGLVLFGLINANIGFMKTASSVLCTAGLAVVCTFFPMIVMVTAAAVLVLVHFYSVSFPIAAVSLVIFLIMYIFYFRFTPGKAWYVLLAALAFGLKIPLVIPRGIRPYGNACVDCSGCLRRYFILYGRLRQGFGGGIQKYGCGQPL